MNYNNDWLVKYLELIAFTLIFTGALNWGTIGIFGVNFVAYVVGEHSVLAKAVYILVGLSAIILAVTRMLKLANQD